MSIKLVKFSNGKFGVRRERLFYPHEYRDLSMPDIPSLWWEKTNKNFIHCMSSEEVARKFIEEFKASEMEKNRFNGIADEVIE